MYDYEVTDRTIEYIDSQIIKCFGSMKGLVSFDELHVMKSVSVVYEKLYKVIREAFLLLAQRSYNDERTKQRLLNRKLDEQWLDDLMDGYDPTSKYVFSHEFDRRRARYAEALISSTTKAQETDAAIKSMSLMCRSFAVRVTDEAALQAMIDEGIERVMWISEKDMRVCKVCRARDGKIYRIENLPPKPHFNCRCIYRRVKNG